VTLIFGRRYGLIGRNGLGKSTLLRTLSKRQLVIAKHISILHVEQEVIGDDTQALQSVLVKKPFFEYPLSFHGCTIVLGDQNYVCRTIFPLK
jgi:ATP-binding cassette subfamily F protein 3